MNNENQTVYMSKEFSTVGEQMLLLFVSVSYVLSQLQYCALLWKRGLQGPSQWFCLGLLAILIATPALHMSPMESTSCDSCLTWMLSEWFPHIPSWLCTFVGELHRT